MELRTSLIAREDTTSHIITVTIPPNVYPGQTIQVLLGDGRCFDFLVPNGASAGQLFTVNASSVIIRSCNDLTNPLHSVTQSKDDGINVVGAKQFLSANKWPAGLQETFLQSCRKYPVHFFILDNSGSMATFDVHRLVNGTTPRSARLVRGSRWAELVEMAKFHAQLAQAAMSPVEFRFLNDYPPVTVGRNDAGQGMQTLMTALNSQPSGGTPLCKHINDIIIQIRRIEGQLRASGQLAMVVIATDGEASDGDVVQALRPLANLPVWVSVRLCTEDEQVDRYWNTVDNQLIEMKIDIIEDFILEGRQIHRWNPWMTYGEPLHRLREWGIGSKEMDLAQQQALSPDQMRVICGMILFGSGQELPNPTDNWDSFISAIRTANSREPEVWSPYSRGPRHWIFSQDLSLAYNPAYVTACCIYYGMCAFILPCFW